MVLFCDKNIKVTFLNPFCFLGLGVIALIARKSFLVFLITLLGSIMGYVALFFIIREMGATTYGIIGFGIAFVGLFSFISDLGFNRAHIKRVSEGKDLDKCIGTYLVIKLVLIAIMVGFVLVALNIWKYVMGRGYEHAEQEGVIYIFIIYYVLLSLSSIPLGTFSARRETAKQQIPGLLEPLTRVPITIFVAIGSLGVFALAGSYVIGVAALLIVALLLFRGFPIGKFDVEVFKSYFRFAIPISIATSISLISANIDKVMLQLFWNATTVGYYFGVQKVTIFLVSISTAVTVLLFPTLSRYHGKKEKGDISKVTLLAERYVSLVVIPLAALMIVFSKPILNLFSGDMADNATGILQIMAVYAVIFCFYAVFINQILAVDRPGLSAKIGISMALINISLNMVLIPKDIRSLGINLFGLGGEGAAIATALSATCGLVITKAYARKFTGTRWNPKILLHIGAALIMGIILYFLKTIFTIESVFLVGGFCLLGLGIYLSILYLIRELKKEDIGLFLEIINPKKMKNYVVSELREKNNENNDQ
jgi:O-antigen/teichoic acid export membrane protein